MIKVAYLGPTGTFTARAARIYARRMRWDQWQGEAYSSIPEVINSVSKGDVKGIVPVENSLEGSVNITLDMLAQNTEVKIYGEVIISIQQHLLGKQITKDSINVLVTHPQAFAQCYHYISENFDTKLDVRFVASTAEATRIVAQKNSGWAAIAGEEAAKQYGLLVLDSNIQDYPLNQTRFLVLSKDNPPPSGKDKTSIIFALPADRPGGLYDFLGEFAKKGVNLTKIESRPAKKELGDYIFFLDCLGHVSLDPLAGIFKKLYDKTAMLHILGSYPYAPGIDC